MPLLGAHSQHVAHAKGTRIQTDSEDGMRHETFQPGLGRIRGSGRSYAEAERRLHDEERKRYGGNAVNQRGQQGWSLSQPPAVGTTNTRANTTPMV